MAGRPAVVGRPRCGGETPLFLALLPFNKPFPLIGALTGRPPYGKALTGRLQTGRPLTGRLLTGRPLTNYRKTYGALPELGGNFPLCAVDQKRPFFLSWTFCPLRDLSPLQGPLRADRLTGEGPLREGFLREGPLRGGFLREGPLRITGKLTRSYGEGLYQNWAGISPCVP